MIISFIQGIVSYPASGNLQGFLSKTGQYVSLVADNGHTDVAIAHGASNYLVSESVSVVNAWGPLADSTDYWLYWDINTTTAVRSYGFTAVAPIYSSSRPVNPQPDQHWFDLSTKKMFVLQGTRWREVIRVFAAKVNGSTFSPLGSGFPLKPFAGTQVGLLSDNTEVGRIISDNVGKPIRRSDGRFFTSMDDFFLNGSPVNAVRLESGIVIATAQTNMAKFQVVKYTDFDEILPAEYADLETTTIAMLMEDALFGSTVSVCVQGCVTNPDWNWSVVGQPLWVGSAGALVSIDPHVANPIANPVAKAPVGRVLSETSIIFDQGLGGKGEKGDPGSASTGLATNVVYGNVRLTVPAAVETDPVVVGDNDPRNSNARVPLAHNQAASTITTSPHGDLTGVTADLQIAELEDNKVAKAGDTMTGALVLHGDPTSPLEAATKQYVDSKTFPPLALNDLTDVVLTSPALDQTLKFDGTNWVNAAGGGGGDSLWQIDQRTKAGAVNPDPLQGTAYCDILIKNASGNSFTTVNSMVDAEMSDTPDNPQVILTIGNVVHHAVMPGRFGTALVDDAVFYFERSMAGIATFTPMVEGGSSFIRIRTVVPGRSLVVDSTVDGNYFVYSGDQGYGISGVTVLPTVGPSYLPNGVLPDVLMPIDPLTPLKEVYMHTPTRIDANPPVVEVHPNWIVETDSTWLAQATERDRIGASTGAAVTTSGSVIVTSGYAEAPDANATFEVRPYVAVFDARAHDTGIMVNDGGAWSGRLEIGYAPLGGTIEANTIPGTIRKGPSYQVALINNQFMRAIELPKINTLSVVKMEIGPSSATWITDTLELGYKPSGSVTPFITYRQPLGGNVAMEVDPITGDVFIAAPYAIHASDDAASVTPTEVGVHVMRLNASLTSIVWEKYIAQPGGGSGTSILSAINATSFFVGYNFNSVLRFNRATGVHEATVMIDLPSNITPVSPIIITSISAPDATTLYVAGNYINDGDIMINVAVAKLTSANVGGDETYVMNWIRTIPTEIESSEGGEEHAQLVVANSANVYLAFTQWDSGNGSIKTSIMELTLAGDVIWTRSVVDLERPRSNDNSNNRVHVVTGRSNVPDPGFPGFPLYGGLNLDGNTLTFAGILDGLVMGGV